MVNENLGIFNAKLGIGPMSSEVIEAVFRYSHSARRQLMLIASKNQIDYNGGYVNNWGTKQYMDFIQNMKKKYVFSDVKVCRDHCGPAFNGKHDLEDVIATIRTDIDCGFDLIHIDFCHYIGSQREKLDAARKAVEYVLKLQPDMCLEIGTDENTGKNISEEHLPQIEDEVRFFREFCNPEFYVVQTGSLVKEINQAGTFHGKFVAKVSQILRKYGLKLKEHNADYISRDEIVKRQGLVDSMNIAPQLGVIQTQQIFNKCSIYGVHEIEDFLELAYSGKKWKKWLNQNTSDNKLLCAIIAGHYHFASEQYKRVIEQLNKYENINETIINTTMEVIGHYENNQ